LIPIVKELFAIPTRLAQGFAPPNMVWSHKKRGFQPGVRNPSEADLNQFTLGWMQFHMKNLVQEIDTGFQSVAIYDVINPRFRGPDSYQKSLARDDSYESRNPELFQPDRVICLDNVMQSRRFGEAAYHEALVHPAIITHPNPKRVAIIGGGEGATLREVLKHNTVETVTMIEIDEIMVNVSRTNLQDWSYCGDLLDSAVSCFDDPRVELYYADAFVWFTDRFVGHPRIKYDVIIMDSL
jgi:Spermine/spermidine synthase domain